mmetsp:Transcript_22144/g.43171  ORF Transcript_22144/g.43171 Transcript_22144/m.43171 type:complete len:91 (-) Transcript_22144:251-523(-)
MLLSASSLAWLSARAAGLAPRWLWSKHFIWDCARTCQADASIQNMGVSRFIIILLTVNLGIVVTCNESQAYMGLHCIYWYVGRISVVFIH